MTEPCEACGSTADVTYGVDPFAHEIFNDDTECWLCERCLNNLADDI